MLSAITVLLFAQVHPAEVKVDGRVVNQAARYSGVHRLHVSGEEPRVVDGILDIRPAGGRYRITLKMDMDRYIAATLAGESLNFPPGEAMKAMAVAIRTFARGNQGRHKAEGADLCDDTHCQKLRFEPNSAAIAQAIRNAVESTHNEYVWYGEEIAKVYYHQHCGGRTESANRVWGGHAVPYLVSQTDPYCVRLRPGEWTSKIPRETLERTHRLSGGEDAPLRLVVASRTESGRVTAVRLGGQSWTGTQFRHVLAGQLGWNSVPSESFRAAVRGADIVLEGRGAGHGVGLCQTGMVSRAAEGHSYRKILSAYLPGTRVGTNPDGFSWHRLEASRVDVFTTMPEADTPLAWTANRLLGYAERLTRRPLTSRPRLRVYPSVNDFRAAAGRDSSFYATADGVLRFQPTGILRSTGSLGTVTLRGLVRLIIDDAAEEIPLRQRPPEWFREGLALHLAPGRLRTVEQQRDWQRVAELMARWGRETVVGWIQTGLPLYVAAEEQRLLAIRRAASPAAASGRYLAP
jgi:stage II sporulation protein D